MKTLIFILLILTSEAALAGRPATLEINLNEINEVKSTVEFSVVGQDISPMYCSMVRQKLAFYQKTLRKLMYLTEKIKNNPNVSSAEIEEFEALEKRQLADAAFLATPAPLLKATWTLSEITGPALVTSLRQKKVKYNLQSTVLNSSDEYGFELPAGNSIQIDTEGKEISLTLSSQIADFCLSETSAHLKIDYR